MDGRTVLMGMTSLAVTGCSPGAGSASSARTGKTLVASSRTNWSRDPLSFGAYSFVAKGTGRGEVRELERPIANKVFFAGEATYPKFNSTVHAA